MQAIAALEKAIIVLAEATSLIQDSSGSAAAAWQKARQGVQDVMVKMPSLLALPEEQTSQVTMFLEGGAQAKSPASATIQGILKDMYDTMADIEFFDMLKKMCLEKYKEWMIRKKQYAEELAGHFHPRRFPRCFRRASIGYLQHQHPILQFSIIKAL